MHHALMNILEPVFERSLIYHSYACRKGKGTHAAVLYAFKQCRKGGYFVKLDVRKYFDSIDHEILKDCIARYIKDVRVLFLLDQIIDRYETAPGKGVPIGNLTSQFFANSTFPRLIILFWSSCTPREGTAATWTILLYGLLLKMPSTNC
jgi:retron-type reverse transcriptase